MFQVFLVDFLFAKLKKKLSGFSNLKKRKLPKSSSSPNKHIFVRAQRVCLLWGKCLLWASTVSKNETKIQMNVEILLMRHIFSMWLRLQCRRETSSCPEPKALRLLQSRRGYSQAQFQIRVLQYFLLKAACELWNLHIFDSSRRVEILTHQTS